jgi:hypothetical protein
LPLDLLDDLNSAQSAVCPDSTVLDVANKMLLRPRISKDKESMLQRPRQWAVLCGQRILRRRYTCFELATMRLLNDSTSVPLSAPRDLMATYR